jgi:hypothetical protein
MERVQQQRRHEPGARGFHGKGEDTDDRACRKCCFARDDFVSPPWLPVAKSADSPFTSPLPPPAPSSKSRATCNRIIQDGRVIKPGERVMVLLRGRGGELKLPFEEAVFGGPARSESRNHWFKRERAPVVTPAATQRNHPSRERAE